MTISETAPHIETLKARFSEIEEQLSAPDIYTKSALLKKLSGERRRLEHIFTVYNTWCKAASELAENLELLKTEDDPEFKSVIENDIEQLKNKDKECENAILLALVPPDPNDSRDAIVEMRPAAGGDEAALFTAEMFRMISRYAEIRGWKQEILSISETELGGLKEVVFSLTGEDVFSRLKYESGVHRVQRVPATEASGRIHTSTITVSVLPEADETDDIKVRPEDIEIDTFRSSGPGGQNVNRTDSAVRIHHKPSGIIVASQQERSQIRNREIAMRILKTKLLERKRSEEAATHAAEKRSQIGTGDRSEKIRTYNFPQDRVTDHRFRNADGTTVSCHNIQTLMAGALDLILDPVFEAESRETMNSILTGECK